MVEISNVQNKARKALRTNPKTSLELFYKDKNLSKHLLTSFKPRKSFEEKAIIL